MPAPPAPTTATPTGWSTTEPTYTPGTEAKALYVCDKTLYTDETFEYSAVSLSSTYAAVTQLADADWRYWHSYSVSANLWRFDAHLTHGGIDVTATMPADNFLWYKKTQVGKTLLGSGQTITVDVTGFELGGAVVGVYTDEFSTVTLTGETVVFDSGNVLALTAVSAEITAEQDLHGYSSAWGAGGGKNKLGLPTYAELSTYSKTNSYYNCPIPVKASTAYYLNTTYLNGYTGGGLLVLVASSKANNSWKSIAHSSQGIVNGSITSDANGYIWLNVYDSVTEAKWVELVENVQTMLSEGSSAGTYEPYTNICPITGVDEVKLVHSPTTDAEDGTTYTISLASAGTVYGGTLNVTAGTLTVTHGMIASYAGETLPGAWISSMDTYTEGSTPTTGAQVVHELATPQTYSLTPTQIQMLTGTNRFWADSGDTSVTLLQEGA